MSYTSIYADLAVDPAYKKFFESFYKISDTPDAHDQYANQFTKDATLIMASKKVQGSEGILALRKGMWEKVASRSHNPIKVFAFGSDAHEFMLYGTVNYVLKDQRQAEVDWAARAVMSKKEGDVKMEFYQVYLDTAAQQNAK